MRSLFLLAAIISVACSDPTSVVLDYCAIYLSKNESSTPDKMNRLLENSRLNIELTKCTGAHIELHFQQISFGAGVNKGCLEVLSGMLSRKSYNQPTAGYTDSAVPHVEYVFQCTNSSLETACDGSPNMKRRVLSAAIENDYLIIIAKCTLETAPRIVYNTSTEWPQSDANKSFPQQCVEAEKMRLIKASVQNSILDRREKINEIVKGVTSTTFLIIYGAVMFLLLLLMVGLCAVSIIVRRPLTKQQRMALRRRRREQAILLRARRRAKRRAASANRTVAQTSAATGTTRLDTEVAIGVKG